MNQCRSADALRDFKLLNLLFAHSEIAESENTVGGKESSLLNAQTSPNRGLHPVHPRSSRRIRETAVPKEIWWGSSDLAMRGCEDAIGRQIGQLQQLQAFCASSCPCPYPGR
jgi:hypothetical protein